MKWSWEKAYQVAIIAAALVLFSHVVDDYSDFLHPSTIPLILLGVLVESIQIPLGRGTGSLTFGVVLGTMCLHGPYVAALLISLAHALEPVLHKRNKRPLLVVLFNAGQHTLSVFAAYYVYHRLGGGMVSGMRTDSMHLLVLIPSTFAYMVVNHLAVYTLFWMRGDRRLSDFGKLFLWDLLNYLISSPFAIFMVEFPNFISMLFLTFLPLVLFGQVLKLYRRITQINRVNEMTYQLQSEFDLQKIYRTIVDAAEQVTHANATVLWVMRGDRVYPVCVSDDKVSVQLPVDGISLQEPGVVANTMHSKRVDVIHDVEKDIRGGALKGGAHFLSILSVPLVSRDNVVGVITCYGARTYAFTNALIDLITVFASHVGVLIENANLYRELQEATLRDPGTGLYNYRHFYQELGRRFKIAKTNAEPLSIVVIDIDHFKKYNDTYGHVVGDEVLRQTGQVVQRIVGDRGVVARYGGEEFAVILGLPLEDAKPLLEQIRRGIAHNRFEYQGYVVQGVTISAGLASYPDHDQDEKELLEKADQAMYWGAKQRGRNKVAVYNPEYDAHLFVDQLTGLYTYHYLHIKMMEEFTAGVATSGQPFALIFLNIVEFDKINRSFGFEVGNQVLREFSMLIKQNIRNGEISARYGGDEFLLLVPGVDRTETEKICERLVKAIAEHPFRVGDPVLIRVQTRYDVILYPEEVAEEHQLISMIPQTFFHLSTEWIESTHQQAQDA